MSKLPDEARLFRGFCGEADQDTYSRQFLEKLCPPGESETKNKLALRRLELELNGVLPTLTWIVRNMAQDFFEDRGEYSDFRRSIQDIAATAALDEGRGEREALKLKKKHLMRNLISYLHIPS
jgi:hypothetical protein